jgi:mRNA-degrading endonuclease toxin of MazEF toxin-antitoxin module
MVVLTRDSAISYLSTVSVAPITATIRGVPSEVAVGDDDGMKALRGEPAQYDYGLSKPIGARLSGSRMSEICAALRFSLGCDQQQT